MRESGKEKVVRKYNEKIERESGERKYNAKMHKVVRKVERGWQKVVRKTIIWK